MLSYTTMFCSFPTSEEKRQLWLQAVGKYEVAKSAAVCSDHFKLDDFYDINSGLVLRRQIKKNAVPSCHLSNISR